MTGDERRHEPDVAFRGARNYVHTADFYQMLVDGARAVGLPMAGGALELNIRSLTRRQPRYVFGAPGAGARAGESGVMDFRYECAEGIVHGHVEERAAPVEARKPYDEARIWDPAVLDGRRAVLKADTGMAPMEVVTALGVLQHKTLYPPPEGHRWLCVRVRLDRPLAPADVDDVEVEMIQMIGRKISKSTVAVHGRPVGHMSFILGAP